MGRKNREDYPGGEAQSLREDQRGSTREGPSIEIVGSRDSRPRRYNPDREHTQERRPGRRQPQASRDFDLDPTIVGDDEAGARSRAVPSRRMNRSATLPSVRSGRVTGAEHQSDVDQRALVRRHSEVVETHERRARTLREQPSLDALTDTDSSERRSDSLSEDALEQDEGIDEEADDEAPRRRNKVLAENSSAERREMQRRLRNEEGLSLQPDESDDQLVPLAPSKHATCRALRNDVEHEPIIAQQPRRRHVNKKYHSRSSRAERRPTREEHEDVQEAPEDERDYKTSTVTSSRSSTASFRRPSNVLGNFFAGSPAPKKAHKQPAPTGERVECVICMSEVSRKRSAHLRCDHNMCNRCLKRLFTLSVEDASHMPPKCCTKEHIQLKHVEKLFDLQFKKLWNRKFVEYTTKNRLYCPAKRCGQFIKPSRIRHEKGRTFARCASCDTKVCAQCNNRWHKTVECPADATMDAFLDEAEKQGWQRCYRCKAMVELREGCNHMTCRCGAEFCMICGTKWKGCDCPWFTDAAVAADRWRHMNEPPPAPRGDIGDIFDGSGPPMPQEFRDLPAFGGSLPMRPRVLRPRDFTNYLQEQDDADMARRMQVYGDMDEEYAAMNQDRRRSQREVMGFGNATGHHMNYHYVSPNRAPSSATMVPGPPPASYERGLDYVSDVSRARGMRESSLERRLAQRLGEQTHVRRGSVDPMAGSPPSAVTAPTFLPSSHSYRGSLGKKPVRLSAAGPLSPMYGSYGGDDAPTHRYASVPRSATSHLEYMCYDEEEVASPFRPRERRSQHKRRSSASESSSGVTSSSMAGLTGPGRGMERVLEWSSHVAPGLPASPAGA